ncbi:MAG: DUF547 domain-containing protein [Bacteroidetes bacterium]|nr:DUF547 domain-containing protein [Bacteroidota bacterium]MCZ2133506.1 DUF547 domain-containing protein [Bacteroidota bacterium]
MVLSLVSADEMPKTEHFSHETFDLLLQENTRGGLVNYRGFDTPNFNLYCERLLAATPDLWSANEQLAFWLNAYNASTIQAILKRPGMKMANNFAGFFTADTFIVAGKVWTLQSLRDNIIKKFKIPLAHFGAMLPAMGAPRPPSRAFRAKNVMAELEKTARQYFRTENGCVLDIAAKALRLSWLCMEYRKDFEAGGRTLLAAVLPYLDDKTAAFATVYKDQITIDFLPFDWRLNARRDGHLETDVAKPYYTRKDTAAAKTKSSKKK